MNTTSRYFHEARHPSELCVADFSSPKRAKRMLQMVKKVDNEKTVKIKRLQNKNRYLLHKVSNLKSLISHLLFNNVKNGWKNYKNNINIKSYWLKKDELTIEQTVLMRGHRVIIPKILQNKVLAMLHQNHMGIVKTKKLARSYVWWPKMDHDIESVIKSCKSCSKYRDSPTFNPLGMA